MLVSRLLVLFVVTFFLTFQANAQISEKTNPKDVIISGQVTDSKTNKPIPLVEIFISGTTRGCISDQNGMFSLKVPFIPCTIVADHVSYEAYISPINGSNNKLEILLDPGVVSIEEVKITGKSNRKKNLRYFYSHFIRENKKMIEILNDSVLYFKNDKKEFTAYTNEPLIIVNKVLGYKTKLIMKRFRVIRTEYPNGPKLKLNSNKGEEYMQISGVYFYEELEANSLKEILAHEKNRRLRYFGSDRHFLKSVYHGSSQQQGFRLEVFPGNRDLKGIRKVENFNTGYAGKKFLVDCDSLKVTYKFGKNRYPYNYSLQNKSTNSYSEVSTIYRSNVIFTLRENGTSPNLSFIITGPMTSVNNLANSLPMDYDPF